MSESNKKTRDQSIPFVASTFRNSSGGTVGTTDAGLIRSSSTLIAIRCSVPDRATLTEAHLNLLMNVAAATNVYIGIGRFDTDGITAISSYTDDQIKAMHRAITGGDTPIASSGGTLLVDGVNIFPLIPKRGSANFNADGFVVIMQFNRSRVSASDVLKRFDVMCSAQMGVV